MNLLNTIVEHQNLLLLLYRKLEERFDENDVIRTLWRNMADDVSLQIRSLKSLPSSFWNQFKNVPNDNFESAGKCVSSLPADVEGISLRNGFELSLRMAEPIILKIYAQLIRRLRKNSTIPAINFYIIVKAYIARLERTTGSFAGDPVLIRRARTLMPEFEKEVQEPGSEIKAQASNALPAKEKKSSASGKAGAANEKAKKLSENVKASVSKSVKITPAKDKAATKKTLAATRRA